MNHIFRLVLFLSIFFTLSCEKDPVIPPPGTSVAQNYFTLNSDYIFDKEEATEAANLLHDDAIHPSNWTSAVNTLRNQLDHARNK